MEQFVAQSDYNLEFLHNLEEKEPDRYFDWKITVAFYSALHCIKAVLAKRGESVQSHEQINSRISHRRNPKSPISQECWRAYNRLFQLSQSVRYNGFKNETAFQEHCRQEFRRAKVDLAYIRKYVFHRHQIELRLE